MSAAIPSSASTAKTTLLASTSASVVLAPASPMTDILIVRADLGRKVDLS